MRQQLYKLQDLITEARKLTAALPKDEAGYWAKVDNGLIGAEDNLLNLIEENSVRCEGKPPLDKLESIYFDNLNNHLRFTAERFSELTHEQKFSAARVMARNLPLTEAHLTDHLGLVFPHIYIGIEADGYTHS